MSDDFSIDVRVRVPQRRFKTLHAQAVREKTDVAQLLRAIVIELVPEAQEPRRMTREEMDAYIARRNGEGAIDSVIAREVGVANSTLADRRARLGLPPRGIRKNEEKEVAS